MPIQCTRKRCVLPGVTKKDDTPHRPWVETASSILEANPAHPGAIYFITGTTVAERTSVSQYLQQTKTVTAFIFSHVYLTKAVLVSVVSNFKQATLPTVLCI